VDPEKKLEKLRTEFETLDDAQKNYIVGIARALSFASGNPVPGLSPPEPEIRGAEKEKGCSESTKKGEVR
jgi:hypothetical protein